MPQRPRRSQEDIAERPFELRVEPLAHNEVALSVWQYPLNGDARGQHKPQRVARLKGLALHALWDDILELLRPAGVTRRRLSAAKRRRQVYLPEPVGVRVALLAAAAAPLRKLERMERIAQAIRGMTYEEACYWYAHARSQDGRRALKALRILLAPE